MLIIGLTGRIGSGKSTVSRLLHKLGAAVIDTDKLGHAIYKPGSKAWSEIIRAFGKQVLDREGMVDRMALGNIVFHDKKALEQLNEITHPLILEKVNMLLARYKKKNYFVVVIDAPLLVEAGWQNNVDEVWVITASKQNVHKRLKKQRGLNEKEISDRIDSRYSDNKLLQNADVIIRNDDNRELLKRQIETQWTRLIHEQDNHH